MFKMTKVVVSLICATVVFALTMSAGTQTSDTSVKDLGSMRQVTTAKYQNSRSNENRALDMQLIMDECNDTFRIELAYLEALNESGSFTDETDKTPKCYIRCLLENMGIMSRDDGMFNPARAAVLFAGERNGKVMDDIGNMTEQCADRRETCKCERAYKFMRCLMSMEIEKYGSNQ